VTEPSGEPRADESAEPRQGATGDPRVDEAVATMASLDGAPVTDHVAVFDEVHRRLQDTLATLDRG
jgi:hypothetical protein